MITVVDRVPTKPNRIKLTKEKDGTVEFYTFELADEPVTVGTLINAELFNQIKTDLENRITKGEIDKELAIKFKDYYNKLEVETLTNSLTRIKKNLTITPIENTDSNKAIYPFKYTLDFQGVTSNDIAETSLALGIECDELKGLNTIENGVEILFSKKPSTPVKLSYVSVTKGNIEV